MTPTPDRAALLAEVDAWIENYRRLATASPQVSGSNTLIRRLAAEVRSLEADAKRLRETIHHATSVLSECDGIFNHPRFTDRHATGERVLAALKECRSTFDAIHSEAAHE